MSGPTRFSFEVTKADSGRRLDQVLADRVPDLSRRKARVLLDIGGVFVNGLRVKVAGKKVFTAQRIEAVLGGALERATATTGRAARAKDDATLPEYRVVLEDPDIVVVDKPPGLLTAPTPESDRGNLAKLLAERYGSIFVVHRIDLETSGLLVFARTDEANIALSARFRDHDLTREYLAVVEGAFRDSIHVVEHPINGKRAVTHFKIEERFGVAATAVRATLQTGRTHQIRIHCRVRGFPVLGDRLHGKPPAIPIPPPPRMALHATKLAIVHPRTGEQLSFECPWPKDLSDWMAELRTAVAAMPPSPEPEPSP
jgi:23S rRNA pseudouridine1911/1915/1917 synthase